MYFDEFLSRQGVIYDGFEVGSVTLATEGTKPARLGFGGYCIILRHPDDITERVAGISAQIARMVPAVEYTKNTIHTTITDHSLEDEFTPDGEVLQRLCDIVHAADLPRHTRIIYGSLLYNQNSVIVRGVPNEQFLDIAKEIHAASGDLELRLPWGAHITASRFTEIVPPSGLSDVLHFLSGQERLGASVPQYLDVGSFSMQRDGFSLQVYERFEL